MGKYDESDMAFIRRMARPLSYQSKALAKRESPYNKVFVKNVMKGKDPLHVYSVRQTGHEFFLFERPPYHTDPKFIGPCDKNGKLIGKKKA